MLRKFCILIIFSCFALVSTDANGQTVAPSNGSLRVGKITKPVIVRRDQRGIPYIEAENDADLYFAQGYATAQDRLWQMDLLRRVARGELAELFGESVFEEDKRWRKYGFGSIVQESYAKLSPEMKKSLEFYALGVNEYIASLDEKSLPLEFQILRYKPTLWKPTDSLIIGKILSDALSSSWQWDISRAAFADLPKEEFDQLFPAKSPFDTLVVGKDSTQSQTGTSASIAHYVSQFASALEREAKVREASLSRIGLYSEDLAVSNNWVISGKRTFDGKAILANDPHLRPSAPSIWHLVNLATPKMRVSGVTFPGTPGVVLGHNEFIAWGATNLDPDVQDLYLETFNDKNQYKTPRGWVEAKIRTEEISVRKGLLSTEQEKRKIEVVETNHGVVFFEEAGKRYALRWTARDSNNVEMSAFFRINRARNWLDFKSALKSYGGATQNFVFADVRGNIGYYGAGKIPIRKSGGGSMPFDGAKNEGEWIGYIPFEELPNAFNPAEGFIVTANQRIAGDSYKYYLTNAWSPPYRARRIHDLLSANPKQTIDTSKDIQRDIFNISFSETAREILRMNAASPETLTQLRGWDGKMSADSRAALLLSEIRNVFLKKILEAKFGVERARLYRWTNQATLIDWLIREQPPEWKPGKFASYREVLMECDANSRASLAKRFGDDDSRWTYGNANSARFPHPLAIAPLIGKRFEIALFPQNGSGLTPNVGASVSMRHISSPGNWDETRHGIALGESGDPTSVHFSDQLENWKSGNTGKFPFSKKAVESATVSLFILNPK